MLTPRRLKIALLLVLIIALTAWSKLRLIGPGDHEPQRWRVDEYPGFQKK